MNDMEIVCFLTVARTGNFTIAAKELNSTQQAVSRNIQSLEKALGSRLLNRGASSVSLTWAGRRFMQWRIEHDAQLSILERRARRLSPEGQNELYIGWNDWTSCPEGLAEDIQGFRQAYPEVKLYFREASTTKIAEMLTDGYLDIAILPEYSTHNIRGLVVSMPFAEQRLHIVSRDMESLPPVNTLSAMRQLAASMGESNDDAIRRRIQMFCAEIGIVPKMLDILPDVRSTFSELLCGNCFTIAPMARPLPGLKAVPLFLHKLRLVFVTPQTAASPWSALFESFVRQRRASL